MSEPHGNSSDHEPSGPPEPKTPMWLPALGAVLFLTVGLIWGLWPTSVHEAGAGGAAGGAASNAAPDAGAPAKQ